MTEFIKKFLEETKKSLEIFKKELTTLKTGRVSPNLVENLLVDCYGQKMPLLQLASINSPDPKTIVIQPWDKGVIKEIEKAISQSDLGVNPTTVENLIRLNFPSPTEESRQKIIKILHNKLEERRVIIRKIREDSKTEIVKAENDGQLSEDEKFKILEELDEETKKKNDELKDLNDQKEKEILTI